jgi:hypothetical protein
MFKLAKPEAHVLISRSWLENDHREHFFSVVPLTGNFQRREL